MSKLKTGKPKPFQIAFPDADLQRLQSRLDDTQLPSEEIVPEAGWEYGSNLQKLRQLTEDWKQGRPRRADGTPVSSSVQGVASWWRGVEKRLNKHPHYTVEIEGVKVHYQIARSQDENAMPILFSHGWPGSFFEAHYLIDELIKTDRNGPSFHVVVPSLIGYGFSGPPPRKGWHLQDTARLFDKLMTQVLEFESGYVVQGGDWGSAIVRFMSLLPSCKMVHVNFHVPNIPPYATPIVAIAKAGYIDLAKKALPLLYDEFEIRGLTRAMEYITTESAYYAINSTKPSTLGYAMYQSPIGILSYLLDKFQGWTDPMSPAFQPPGMGKQTSNMTDEAILISVTLYYLTKSLHTSLLPYFESKNSFDILAKDRKLTQPGAHKPFGYSAFPWELAAGPKAWVPRLNVNFVYYKRHDFGGHFASLEAPQELAEDLREFVAAHWKV